MNRRDFMVGNASGLCIGAVGALGWSRHTRVPEAAAPAAPDVANGKVSYAQQGEDLIVQNVFEIFKIDKPSYIDIGAFDPVIGSNTYLLYRGGSRGVLVEPNPAKCAELRAVRPGDTVVNAGIGVKGEKEADYYIIEGDGQLNTFSREQVDKLAKEGARVKETIKMPLLDVNDVLAKNFKTAPEFLSVDAEGMDLPILSAVDFDRWRPKVLCVETAILGSGTVEPSPAIVQLMRSKEYSLRGGNIVNSVFLDDRFFH